MTPTTVSFTGYEFDPKILSRRLKAPTPANWIRYQFEVEGFYNDPDWELSNWMMNNFFGRWTLNFSTALDGMLVVLGFEEANDAIMFRLMDGETAWRDDSLKVF